jgi:hypothetical protein
VPDDLPDAEILKKIAGTVLGHDFHAALMWLAVRRSPCICLNRARGPWKASTRLTGM